MLLMKDNGLIMRYLDSGFINGLMEENMQVNGKETLWMSLDFILGKMEECMKGFIKRIKSMDMECILGLIRRNMLDGGTMVNNMVQVFLSQKKAKESLVFGKMVKN